MLTKCPGFFLSYQGKIRIHQQKGFTFGLFNFVESFSVKWTSLLKMVFPVTVMANFFIGGTFTTVVRVFAKLAFLIIYVA